MNKNLSSLVEKDEFQKVLDKYQCQVDDLQLHIRLYNEHAETYDDEMFKCCWTKPEELSSIAVKLGAGKESKALDVCCGTGKVGEFLRANGVENVHGYDGSKGMLDVLRKKRANCYKSLTEAIFEDSPDSKLPFEDKTFDFVFIAGGFGIAHLPVIAIYELLRVTKVGGFVLLDFHESTDTSLYQGKIKLNVLLDNVVEKKLAEPAKGFPLKEENDILGNEYVFVLKKLDNCDKQCSCK